MLYTNLNEEELVVKVQKELKEKLRAPLKVGLIGDLGAGKTTLVKKILKSLGVEEEITSPTFNLRKCYKLPSGEDVQHIDLYRLDDAGDSFEVGEWLSEDVYITFVEWPEKAKKFLDKYNVLLKINFSEKDKRDLEIKWN